jgi:hypothetical protein
MANRSDNGDVDAVAKAFADAETGGSIDID